MKSTVAKTPARLSSCLLLVFVCGCPQQSRQGKRPFDQSDVVRVEVYLPDAPDVIAKIELSQEASKVVAELNDAALRDPRALANMHKQNMLARMSVFLRDGSEKRVILLRDGIYTIIGDGPYISYEFDTQSFLDQIRRDYAPPDNSAQETASAATDTESNP